MDFFLFFFRCGFRVVAHGRRRQNSDLLRFSGWITPSFFCGWVCNMQNVSDVFLSLFLPLSLTLFAVCMCVCVCTAITATRQICISRWPHPAATLSNSIGTDCSDIDATIILATGGNPCSSVIYPSPGMTTGTRCWSRWVLPFDSPKIICKSLNRVSARYAPRQNAGRLPATRRAATIAIPLCWLSCRPWGMPS